MFDPTTALSNEDSLSALIDDVDPFAEAEISVQALRDIALRQATSLAERYVTQRDELIKTDGHGFFNLNFRVRARNENRSIQLEWFLAHFRHGQRTGTTSFKKKRGDIGYDLSALKGKSPEWALDLVMDTELKARKIREALMQLTSMDTALRIASNRLGSNASLKSVADGGDDSTEDMETT